LYQECTLASRNTCSCKIDAGRRQVAELYLTGRKQANIAHKLS
jgi:hypothetical protein